MKKGIAIGMLTVASVILFGCQQQVKPATTTTPGEQQATTTATVKIEDADKTTSTGSLEIVAPTVTQESSQGTVVIEPAAPSAPVPLPPVPAPVL